MQSIINEALKNAELEKGMQTSAMTDEDDMLGQPRILIIGCGGAGNNTINRLHNMKVAGAET
ncbi:MAG TPA: cell division protein FtsZ, partial [Methanocorpusculum sp.]|nr:cell division protein FtsZ [Methanocorpusculum sp.]